MKKIHPILSFGILAFLGMTMCALLFVSNSKPLPIFVTIPTVSADENTLPAMSAPIDQPVASDKAIFVSLHDQTLVYMEGTTIIGEFRISSGLPGTPTPPGDYTILKKKPLVNYKGATYNFPNTKWNLMFKTGNPLNYYIHGAPWHHNFGHPMSHGCINVAYDDMEVLYNWADEGTKLVIIQDSLASLPLPSAIYPTPPGILVPTNIKDDSANLSWNAALDPAGITGYKIYQDNVLIATTTDPRYTVRGLTSDTTYRFRVFAYNETNQTSFQSEGVSLTTASDNISRGTVLELPNVVEEIPKTDSQLALERLNDSISKIHYSAQIMSAVITSLVVQP